MRYNTGNMPIVTVPHPALRQKAKPIVSLDKRTVKSVAKLEQTLRNTRSHKVIGVGLAGPQIAESLAVFCTFVPLSGGKPRLRTFINPIMVDHPNDLILGETPADKDPREEGCLSIPKLWGPVPRWPWVKFEFQTIEGDTLENHEEVFENFAARVMQHEFDHLHGILFTDYSLQLDLPVFRETGPDMYEEVDKRLLESW